MKTAADLLLRCRGLTGVALPEAGGALRAGDAALYLAHVALGAPLRRLAEAEGRHPSTVMRAVRRVEQLRDDPLLDDLLAEIEVRLNRASPGSETPPVLPCSVLAFPDPAPSGFRAVGLPSPSAPPRPSCDATGRPSRPQRPPFPLPEAPASSADPAPTTKESALTQPHPTAIAALSASAFAPSGLDVKSALPRTDPDSAEGKLEKEARRILRRLSEPRAFLALARGAQVACVFRKADEALVTLARTPLEMARGFAARDWISCIHSGPTMARYEITSAGRAWLKRALAEDGDARRAAAQSRGLAGAEPMAGLAEAPSVFARQHQAPGLRRIAENGESREVAVNLGETPLGWLARRKGPDGKAFLTPSELAAGERLREDFERAQLGPRVTQDWRRFLTPGDPGSGGGRSPSEGPADARRKVTEALDALGPGLNDVALRACCFLEGLEATERRMGWAARSGKVVLKIALGRLAEHYGYAPAPNPVADPASGPARDAAADVAAASGSRGRAAAPRRGLV